MRFLLATLSLSYARNHLAKTLLTLIAVAVGVATFSAIKSAESALTDGIRATVDRMAGKAQLQLSMDGGVPEEVQEELRSLPAILATAPVIEQLVIPERGELGSVLVLGVDLLGDRQMRDYGFEGEDADIDDPLLFLAQPDSVVVARQLALRAGLKIGDSFGLRTPVGLKRVVVRGLLTPKGFAEAFGGNLAVTDVYAAQEIFGRGRRFDRLEVRLEKDVTLAAGTELLQEKLGPAYTVETPGRRGESLEKLITNFTAGFRISSFIAMGIGTILIMNAFQVSVTRRRRDVGTLRSLGATPAQIMGLFLSEALIIGAIGGVLGLGLGFGASSAFLEMMGKTSEQIFGVSGGGEVRMTAEIALSSILLGVVASLVGAWAPAREAARVTAAEAFGKGRHQAAELKRPLLRLNFGLGLILLASLLAWKINVGTDGTTILVLGVGATGVILLVNPVSRYMMKLLSEPLARIFPQTGRLASDAVRTNPRRTAGTAMATTLSLTFVLGIGGHLGSVKASSLSWMEDVLTSDLYVRASVNWARADFRYPPELKAELEKIPGVRAVESFRNARVQFRGGPISLASIEFGQMMDRTRREFMAGDEESLRREVTLEGGCAVSDNFANLYKVRAGEVITLPAPDGMVNLKVAAILRDLSNDRGTVYIDRTTYLKYWKDDRVDVFDVNLLPGQNPERAREAVRALIGGRYPALISTRGEFVREITQAIDAFFALVRITVFLALLISCLGIASSLVISVAERNREIGILKALGALPNQIALSVVLEGTVIGLTGFALALPLGNLTALLMEKVVAFLYSGWTIPHVYPLALMLTTLVSLPVVVALAAYLPARQAAKLEAAQAITYE